MSRTLNQAEKAQLATMVDRTSRPEVIRYLMTNTQWPSGNFGTFAKVEIDATGKLILSM